MSDRIQLKRPSHTSDTQSSQSIFTPVTPSSIPTNQPTQAPPLGHDFSRISIQPKLTVSQPDDPYEREADRVADEVMRMDDPGVSGDGVMRSLQDTIHRQCDACEDEEEVQAKLVDSIVQRKPLVMRSPDKEFPASGKVESQLSNSQGGGSPLSGETRAFMEPRFGVDFRQVRVHNDSQAAESAQAIHAKAYTSGHDIVFASGQYAPESDAGKQLLAHELTHVVQQSQIEVSPVIQRDAETATSTPSTPSTASDSPPNPDGTTAPTASLFIVEDAIEQLEPGQMHKSEFLGELRPAVNAVAEEAVSDQLMGVFILPMIRTELEQQLSFYSTQDARSLDQAIRLYSPKATQARDYIPVVCGQVRQAIAQRLSQATTASTEPTDDAKSPASESETASAMPDESAPDVMLKSRDEITRSVDHPEALQADLGEGRSLDSEVQSRMGSAFGQSFSEVRLHTDPIAAKLAGDLNARAFAVGTHVAFAPGEYQPGTLIGDALIAHELAHVVQQQGAPAGLSQKGQEESSALEADADLSAIGAVSRLWFGFTGAIGNVAKQAVPRLRSGLGLQRCSGCSTTPARIPDQHAETTVPDAARLAALRRELNPGSTTTVGGVSVAVPWDGASTGGAITAAAKAARAVLKRDLTQAMTSNLDSEMPEIRRVATARHLPMTEFEGAGRAAKQVTDAHFGSWATAAALTPAQAGNRTRFQFQASGPNPTLLNAHDPAQRTLAGLPVNPSDLAGWIANTHGSAIQQVHHFNQSTPGEQQDFFVDKILTPFVNSRRADLEKFDLYGFAMTGDRIVVGSNVMLNMPDAPGDGGEPSPAERAAKWGVWKTLVHEYLHTLAHPVFKEVENAGQVDSRIMMEGFCELFTKEVLSAELLTAPKNVALRTAIEGGSYSPPTPDIVGSYDPGSYADYLRHAENIRDTVIGGAGGINAVKAAYFQGHVEFLGLDPHGNWVTPAAPGSANLISVPAGITTLAALATATGATEAEIRAANPGLTPAAPLPASLNLPGCREHLVVEATNQRGTKVFARQMETKAQIATQNGVTGADLDRANPSVNWTTLTAGQHILIPWH